MIHSNIKTEIKIAMLAKDQIKLEVVRGMLAAFTNELVAKKRKPDEMLDDDEALAVIKRLAKQREDAATQFRAGGRPELAEQEEKELAILKNYLPAQMSVEETRKVVERKKAELGTIVKSDTGKLIGAVMRELKGNADGTMVKTEVDKLFE